ncbi:Leucine-rich repeat protein kinase family protein [Euphorbia peplus]|nr:Leucine-rich repeat protein kinase family protein [Euphorbia peplus]
MSHKRIDVAVFLYILALLTITITTSAEPDIDCLKSIKNSLEDPYGYLSSSWNFNNNTPGFVCSFSGVDCWNNIENRVISLRLSNMGLKGEFPLGIANCTSLTGLNFSSNELNGSIPTDIGERLPFVTLLDLSFNNFSGEIPSSIANCSFLNILKLNRNSLSGRIPGQIGGLARLRVFSVANNMLSGKVPNFVNANFTPESYANNSGLCGGPLERCQQNYQRKMMTVD